MSETETREPAELTADEWVDAFLGQPRFVQVALAERIIAESRAVTDLAAARAEVAALRSAVETLADDMDTQAAESTPLMAEVWTVAARETSAQLEDEAIADQAVGVERVEHLAEAGILGHGKVLGLAGGAGGGTGGQGEQGEQGEQVSLSAQR